MRVPIRKPGKFTHLKPDTHITEVKFLQLKNELQQLKNEAVPKAAKETKRLAEMGDLSENAAYSIAKNKLRFLNQKVIEITQQLAGAEIIKTNKNTGTVQTGHRVTLELNNKTISYLILGSAEIDLKAGVISFRSPLGSALLGHKVGEIIKIKIKQKEAEYKIISIE